MKLQELFKQTDFDKMFDYIVKFHPKSENSWYGYRVAYELLCDMEPEGNGEVDVVPNRYAKEEGDSEFIVWCPDLEGREWEIAVGSELNFCPEAEGVPLDMIAGLCLWHLTFYGFTPEEKERAFGEMTGEDAEDDEPKYVSDILSEKTNALRPDLPKLDQETYDRQYEIYRAAREEELNALASQGDKYGLYFLAEAYGRGKNKDLEKAFSLYRASAEQGFSRARNMLAIFYENGIGTERNLDKAREQYRLAMEAPYSRGIPEENLAHLELREGNYADAVYWFKEAAKKGNNVGKSYIWFLETKMQWKK